MALAMAACGEALAAAGGAAFAVGSTDLPLVPLEPDSLRPGSWICFPEGNMNRRSPSHEGRILAAGSPPLAVVMLVGMRVGGVSLSAGVKPVLPSCTCLPDGNMNRRSCQDEEEDMMVFLDMVRVEL